MITAVGAVAAGLLLVLVDLRFGGVDAVPDVLGWVLVVLGTRALARTDPRWRPVVLLAAVAALLSLASLWHPVVTVTAPGAGDGVTTSTTGPVDPVGLHGLLVSAHHAVAVVCSVLLSLRVRDRARAHDDGPVARRFTRFAVLHAVLGAVVLLVSVVAALEGTPEQDVTGSVGWVLLVLVVAAVAVQVWFVAALAGVRQLPWLQPGSAAVRPR